MFATENENKDVVVPGARRFAIRDVVSRPDRLAFVLVAAAYAACRLVILDGLVVVSQTDAGSYAPRPGKVEPFETLSFTGHAPRPWGAPLLYSLVPTDHGRVLLQWSLGTLAWGLLVFALWGVIRWLPAKIIASLAVIGLSLSSAVYTWDFVIQSESLSINLGVLALALFIIWARTGSKIALLTVAAVGVWWTFTRQDLLPYIALLMVVLVVCAWRRADRRLSAGIAAAVLALGLGWNGAIASTTDEAFRSWGSGVSLSEGTFIYRLRFQIMNDPVAKKVHVEQFGMPPCPEAEAIARRGAWAMARFTAAYRGCPELVEWSLREKGTLGIRYAAADPKHFAGTVLRTLPHVLGGTVGSAYGKPVPAIPELPDRVYFPPRSWVLPIALSLFVAAIIANLCLGALRRRDWLAAIGTVVAAASLASAVGGMLYSAGEYGRFGIQEAILLRLGLIVMTITAIDAAHQWLVSRGRPSG